MKRTHANLRVIAIFLVAAACLLAGLAVGMWMRSNAQWQHHRDAAYTAGITLYNAMQNGTEPPDGVLLTVLDPEDQEHARNGRFRQISAVAPTARITNVPISADVQNVKTGAQLVIAILSPELTYGLADLPHRNGQTAAETLGAVTRKLASYCSDPFVVAQMGESPWARIEGADVWGCEAAPNDRRLLAALLAIVGFGTLITVALNISSEFTHFANQLRNRRRVGGPTRYSSQGPQELREIVEAVNSYLEVEREQLASRAAVLSGVSHDLGTPATRLRLRAALIEDPELRTKLETDIDSMTGIIESVLTYTHAEMDAEAPRRVSLTSLVDAIVADYQDLGSNVKLVDSGEVVVQGASSIFMSRQGQSTLTPDRDIIISARPVSLQRALTNLIDNAIKYGRRATVALETTAEIVTIVIEDEGSDNSAQDIETLMAPFQRGENTATVEGHGLGLTIVATIAKLHGGSLEFEDSQRGVAARLSIPRH